jgi:hypothetical protein
MGLQEGSAGGLGSQSHAGRESAQGLERSVVAARAAAHERRGETSGARLDEPEGESSVSRPVASSRFGSVG